MAERTSYAPGTPSWVDIGVPDTAVAAAFYGDLFGWAADIDPRPEAGGYGMFTLRGKNVAGVGPQMNADMPPFWTVYVTVAEADATVAIAAANGGTVIVEPMDVFDAGRMGVLQDPMGSVISIWQPNQHIGAQLVNEPGTFVWNELVTTDPDRAAAFYQATFGWQSMSDGTDAKLFTLNGNMLCGAHAAGDGEFPAWSVWFAVADCDASATRVEALGGSIVMPPTDMSFGRAAGAVDPSGALFNIATINE